MNYIAVRGKGDPNDKNGDYVKSIEILYAIAYTLRMSYKGNYKINRFFEYVVPPLEGFWWQDGVKGVDYTRKNKFQWISFIRLPDFVSKDDFNWAMEEVSRKKKIDCLKAEFLTNNEGLCVQMMHIGPFDEEPDTVSKMDEFLVEQAYENDFSEQRLHHEIYLPKKSGT